MYRTKEEILARVSAAKKELELAEEELRKYEDHFDVKFGVFHSGKTFSILFHISNLIGGYTQRLYARQGMFCVSAKPTGAYKDCREESMWIRCLYEQLEDNDIFYKSHLMRPTFQQRDHAGVKLSNNTGAFLENDGTIVTRYLNKDDFYFKLVQR